MPRTRDSSNGTRGAWIREGYQGTPIPKEAKIIPPKGPGVGMVVRRKSASKK